MEFPHSATDREESVRHHLSRALFLSIIHDCGTKFPRTTDSSCSTSTNSRRTAVRCGFMPRTSMTIRSNVSERGETLRQREAKWGVRHLIATAAFRRKSGSDQTRECSRFSSTRRAHGKSIAGYGAPGKGNTLLNYCGIRTDFLDYTVDANLQAGQIYPGTAFRFCHPNESRHEARLSLNSAVEFEGRDHAARRSYIREWGGKFVVPIPELSVYE